MLGFSPSVEIAFSVLDPSCALIFVFSACFIRHLANPSTTSILCMAGTRSFACSIRGVQAGHHPENIAGGDPLASGDWPSLLKVILLCLFSVWVKHFFMQSLCKSCLSWSSHTMQRVDILDQLFLVAGIVMFFAMLHEVGLLPWRWKQVLLAWVPQY